MAPFLIGISGRGVTLGALFETEHEMGQYWYSVLVQAPTNVRTFCPLKLPNKWKGQLNICR